MQVPAELTCHNVNDLKRFIWEALRMSCDLCNTDIFSGVLIADSCSCVFTGVLDESVRFL